MRTDRSWIALMVAVVVCASLSTGIAHAFEGHGHFGGHPEEHRGGGHEHWDDRGRRGWHGVDVERWHGGRWFHGEHGGRLGWWWIVGDGWHFYPAPIYPYPDAYVPPAAAAPSPDYWFYCASAGAYYPYVTECPEGWQPVVPRAPGS